MFGLKAGGSCRIGIPIQVTAIGECDRDTCRAPRACSKTRRELFIPSTARSPALTLHIYKLENEIEIEQQQFVQFEGKVNIE